MFQINKNTLVFVLLFLLGLIWGSSFLFIKFTVLSLKPLTAVFLRMIVATLCLFIYLKIKKIILPIKKKDFINYFTIAVLGNAFPFVLVSWAEISINTNVTGIIMGFMPITTVFLAYFFVKEEKINFYTFLGILLGFVGLFFLLDIVSNKNINQIDLPKSIRVGAILRKGKIIIPNSATIFEENDDVVFFAETKSIKKLEKLLSIRQAYA